MKQVVQIGKYFCLVLFLFAVIHPIVPELKPLVTINVVKELNIFS